MENGKLIIYNANAVKRAETIAVQVIKVAMAIFCLWGPALVVLHVYGGNVWKGGARFLLVATLKWSFVVGGCSAIAVLLFNKLVDFRIDKYGVMSKGMGLRCVKLYFSDEANRLDKFIGAICVVLYCIVILHCGSIFIFSIIFKVLFQR